MSNTLASLKCEFELPSHVYPKSAGKPVSLLEFFDPDSKHRKTPIQATETTFTIQPSTNPVVVISPSEPPQDRPRIVNDGSFFSTPKASLVSPELECMRQAGKIYRGFSFEYASFHIM